MKGTREKRGPYGPSLGVSKPRPKGPKGGKDPHGSKKPPKGV